MNECFNCRLDTPYPEVRTQGRNTAYAAILTESLAGQASETTAILQYVFQHVICRNERISKAMACIANVEMHHYEMISELIFDLGGNPRVAAQNGCSLRYWNGQMVDYATDPKCFLKSNILAENAAIAGYNCSINQICDSYVREVLERIILDEQHHISIFNELLAGL